MLYNAFQLFLVELRKEMCPNNYNLPSLFLVCAQDGFTGGHKAPF